MMDARIPAITVTDIRTPYFVLSEDDFTLHFKYPSYFKVIDSILAASDLNHISEKRILECLQESVDFDITPYKAVIKDYIGARINDTFAQQEAARSALLEQQQYGRRLASVGSQTSKAAEGQLSSRPAARSSSAEPRNKLVQSSGWWRDVKQDQTLKLSRSYDAALSEIPTAMMTRSPSPCQARAQQQDLESKMDSTRRTKWKSLIWNGPVDLPARIRAEESIYRR
ncbi:hypothetical protein VTN96DRAFT_3293 [Rasamsonia emersonii]